MPDAIAPLNADDLVLSDFDGTISLVDTGIAVIDGLELEGAWDIEYMWRRGEIGSMECLARQWEMVKLPPAELYEFIDALQLDPRFHDFLALVHERQAGIAVLSDGLDFYVDRLLGREGVRVCQDETLLRDPDCLVRFANAATITEGGVKITFPHCNECGQCGNCKVEHLFRLRQGFRRVIYIGDGHSDLCAARYADVIFAKDALAEDCVRAGRVYYPFKDFADVISVLT